MSETPINYGNKAIRLESSKNLLTGTVWYKTTLNGKFVEGSQTQDINEAHYFFDMVCTLSGISEEKRIIKELTIKTETP